MRRRERRQVTLEMKADAFLRETPQPQTPRALVNYGAQRAAALASVRETAAGRRVYRRPLHAYRIALIALLAFVLVLGAGPATYAASLDAEPGSLLYGSKIFFERARIFLTVSRAEDARLEMEFSERRMEELARMTACASGSAAERWLREYRRNLQNAEDLLTVLAEREASQLAPRFLALLEGQAGELENMRLLPPAAPALSDCLEEAYRICDGSRKRMRMRCGEGCNGKGTPGMPGDGEDKGGKGDGGAGGEPGDGSSTSFQEKGVLPGDADMNAKESGMSDAPAASAVDGQVDKQADTAGNGSPSGAEGWGGCRSGNQGEK